MISEDQLSTEDLLHALAWSGIGAEVKLSWDPRYGSSKVKAFDALLRRFKRLEEAAQRQDPNRALYDIAVALSVLCAQHVRTKEWERLTGHLQAIGHTLFQRPPSPRTESDR